jgi:hypothetical protein
VISAKEKILEIEIQVIEEILEIEGVLIEVEVAEEDAEGEIEMEDFVTEIVEAVLIIIISIIELMRDQMVLNINFFR